MIFNLVVNFIGKIAGTNAHMGLGDIIDNSSNTNQENNQSIKSETNDEMKDLFATIDELNQLLKEQDHSYKHNKVIDLWNLISSKLDSLEIVFDNTPRQLKNNAYYEINKITMKLLEAKE